MSTLLNDIKYSVRKLAKSPGFTLLAVLTLALGIGANTTIFAFVDTFLLSPLPLPDADRLVAIGRSDRPGGWAERSTSYPDYRDIREQSTAFSDVAVHDWEPYNLATQDEPVYVGGARVSGNFFQTLQVPPLLGRTFAEQDDRPDGEKLVVLSETLWRNQFGADPEIVGQTIHLDSIPRQVIGVVPESGILPIGARLWIPLALDPAKTHRSSHGLNVVGRLQGGRSLRNAQAELAAISKRLEEAYPGTNREKVYSCTRLQDKMLGQEAKFFFYFLGGSVGCLLLIVCANVANLLLCRSLSRTRELAIRSALGGSRWDLIRQLLTECIVLALAAGALGLWLSVVGVRLLDAAIASETLSWFTLQIDRRVLGFNVGVALGSVILFGVTPALLATRVPLQGALKESVGASASSGTQRLQRALVIAELAFALMLLAGAGMMIRSFVHLSNVDPGFGVDHRLTASVPLPVEKYKTPEDRVAFYRELVPRLQALPGVRAVGVVSHFPFSGSINTLSYAVEGQDVESVRQNPEALYKVASPDYFRAMDIRLLRGRRFAETDTSDSPRVVIINQPFAEAFWPSEDPVGKRLKFGGPNSDSPWMTVVGVVAGVRHQFIHRPARPHLYCPYVQDPSRRLCLALYTEGDPTQYAALIPDVIRQVDPYQAIYRVMPLADVMADVLLSLRISTTLFWSFGILALGIAAVGIYGVLAFAVSQRRREIGIRITLGATRREVVKMVIHQGMKDCGIGTAIGLVMALVVTRAMGALILEATSLDWISPLIAVAVLGLSALLACYIPAHRAASVDPMKVLRCE